MPGVLHVLMLQSDSNTRGKDSLGYQTFEALGNSGVDAELLSASQYCVLQTFDVGYFSSSDGTSYPIVAATRASQWLSYGFGPRHAQPLPLIEGCHGRPFAGQQCQCDHTCALGERPAVR